MEIKEQIIPKTSVNYKNYIEVREILKARNLLEHPINQYVRENGQYPSAEAEENPHFILRLETYSREMILFDRLQSLYDAMIGHYSLPDYAEAEIGELYFRFPIITQYVELHLEDYPERMDTYFNAILALVPTKNYVELEYVVKAAQNDMSVKIPYNDQFRAVRYLPYKVIVPPLVEDIISIDQRTLINKNQPTIPEIVVDVVSAQSEVIMENPLAIVFDVIDDDILLGTTVRKRVRWDESGTHMTDQKLGLYSGHMPVVFKESIGMKRGKEYVVVKNGVMHFATGKCYITVICDGKHIRTRDQYILGYSDNIGIWRYELRDKRMISRTGGQPEFYVDVVKRLNMTREFIIRELDFIGIPRFIKDVSWIIKTDEEWVYLGRLVKKNKILMRLKSAQFADMRGYISMFVTLHSNQVYYGDRRLLVGEKKKERIRGRAEFKRYPHYYETFKELSSGH